MKSKMPKLQDCKIIDITLMSDYLLLITVHTHTFIYVILHTSHPNSQLSIFRKQKRQLTAALKEHPTFEQLPT